MIEDVKDHGWGGLTIVDLRHSLPERVASRVESAPWFAQLSPDATSSSRGSKGLTRVYLVALMCEEHGCNWSGIESGGATTVIDTGRSTDLFAQTCGVAVGHSALYIWDPPTGQLRASIPLDCIAQILHTVDDAAGVTVSHRGAAPSQEGVTIVSSAALNEERNGAQPRVAFVLDRDDRHQVPFASLVLSTPVAKDVSRLLTVVSAIKRLRSTLPFVRPTRVPFEALLPPSQWATAFTSLRRPLVTTHTSVAPPARLDNDSVVHPGLLPWSAVHAAISVSVGTDRLAAVKNTFAAVDQRTKVDSAETERSSKTVLARLSQTCAVNLQSLAEHKLSLHNEEAEAMQLDSEQIALDEAQQEVLAATQRNADQRVQLARELSQWQELVHGRQKDELRARRSLTQRQSEAKQCLAAVTSELESVAAQTEAVTSKIAEYESSEYRAAVSQRDELLRSLEELTNACQQLYDRNNAAAAGHLAVPSGAVTAASPLRQATLIRRTQRHSGDDRTSALVGLPTIGERVLVQDVTDSLDANRTLRSLIAKEAEAARQTKTDFQVTLAQESDLANHVAALQEAVNVASVANSAASAECTRLRTQAAERKEVVDAAARDVAALRQQCRMPFYAAKGRHDIAVERRREAEQVLDIQRRATMERSATLSAQLLEEKTARLRAARRNRQTAQTAEVADIGALVDALLAMPRSPEAALPGAPTSAPVTRLERLAMPSIPPLR